jgi:UDP-3-O-[3-hydroxymyristoyl] glucosamine N-acyltransferase
MTIDTAELAQRIDGRLEGEARPAHGLADPGAGSAERIVVAADAATLARALAAEDVARCAALLVRDDAEVPTPHPPLIRHADPRLALARASALFDPEPRPEAGVDPAASVHPGARLGAGVHVAAGARVADGAVVGDGSVIGPGAVVGEDCVLGDGVRLFARAVLYPRVHLGDRVRVHAGAVLGADGFGYAPSPRGAVKIHHLGGVRIGDDVEIGANACIDRGTVEDTVVGAGSKIDNLCQIGHNVRIGRHCLIAGTVAIGGSTVVEDGVQIGGGAALSDHVRIGAGARIAGRSGVSKDVPAGEAWGGTPAAPMRDWIRERYLIGRLERIWSFVRAARKDEGRTGG